MEEQNKMTCFIISFILNLFWSFSVGSVVKNPSANAGDFRFHPLVRKIPWTRKWQPTPVFLPGKSQGEESGGQQSTGSLKSRTWLSNYITTTLAINGQTIVPVPHLGTDQKEPWESMALIWTWRWIWTCSNWRLLLWVVVEMPTTTEYISVIGDLSGAFLCSHKI